MLTYAGTISNVSLVSSVFELGPEGVVFPTPVILRMTAAAATSPSTTLSTSAFVFDKSSVPPGWLEVC
jgi:hypothetical protein